jgi:hypothetical protein
MHFEGDDNQWGRSLDGAQTERWDEARPVRDLLGG